MATNPMVQQLTRMAEEKEDAGQTRREAGLDNIEPEDMTGEIERFLRSEREKNGGNAA